MIFVHVKSNACYFTSLLLLLLFNLGIVIVVPSFQALVGCFSSPRWKYKAHLKGKVESKLNIYILAFSDGFQLKWWNFSQTVVVIFVELFSSLLFSTS